MSPTGWATSWLRVVSAWLTAVLETSRFLPVWVTLFAMPAARAAGVVAQPVNSAGAMATVQAARVERMICGVFILVLNRCVLVLMEIVRFAGFSASVLQRQVQGFSINNASASVACTLTSS